VHHMGMQEAVDFGAMALFGEKYGERVRVLRMGEFSTELCGGTHVHHTGDIGVFKITSESGIAAGVRRIEAVTGAGALEYFGRAESTLQHIAGLVKAGREDVDDKVRALVERSRTLEKELQQLKTKLALGGGGGGAADDDKILIGESTLIARQMADVDSESLRTLADTLKSRLKSGVVVLAAAMPEGKVSLIVTVTPDLAKKAPAGELVKMLAPIVGGGGGGRPDFAQAGGKDASKITDLLAAARTEVEKRLQ